MSAGRRYGVSKGHSPASIRAKPDIRFAFATLISTVGKPCATERQIMTATQRDNIKQIEPVSYTHLTLPTNREV